MENIRNEEVEVLIQPATRYVGINVRELIAARFLLWNLVKRNVLTAYVDQRYGVVWTLFKPVLFVLVAIFIKNASQANLQAGLDYIPFIYTGLALWWFFADATAGAARSIYKDRGLITKIYYPRIISPIAPVLAFAVDFFIRISIVPFAMFYYSYLPDWKVVLFPLLLLNVMFLSLGIGLLVASLSTHYRDVEKILAHFLYLGLFLSPVLYSTEMIPEQYRQMYFLINPMAAPLENFRYIIFANSDINWGDWGYSMFISMIVLTVGVFLFTKVQGSLADKV